MAYSARQKKYENAAQRRFNAALRQQVQAVVNYIDETNVDSLDFVIDSLVKEEPIRIAMQTVYVRIAVQEAIETAKDVDRKLPKRSKKVNGIGFFSEVWTRWMANAYLQYTSDKIVDIAETTRERIRTLLSKAKEANLTYTEMARHMKAELNRPDFTGKRSVTIARTEGTRAANLGQMRVANDSNIVLDKKWHHSPIGDFRESHMEAANEPPIPVDEPFIIEGYAMMQPGDPSAPGELTINCRCSISFVPRMDADGLPIIRETGLERELFA